MFSDFYLNQELSQLKNVVTVFVIVVIILAIVSPKKEKGSVKDS